VCVSTENGFIVVKVAGSGVVVGLPGARILFGLVFPGGKSFGLCLVRLLLYSWEDSSSAKEVSVMKELSLLFIVITEAFKNKN
jgi:hypothetical protein